MGLNIATTIANQEIVNNKAQTGLDVLTRTIDKSDQAAQAQKPQSETMRLDIARQTGKGQNIDVKA